MPGVMIINEPLTWGQWDWLHACWWRSAGSPGSWALWFAKRQKPHVRMGKYSLIISNLTCKTVAFLCSINVDSVCVIRCFRWRAQTTQHWFFHPSSSRFCSFMFTAVNSWQSARRSHWTCWFSVCYGALHNQTDLSLTWKLLLITKINTHLSFALGGVGTFVCITTACVIPALNFALNKQYPLL